MATSTSSSRVDIRKPLALITTAYAALEAENGRLNTELENLRRQLDELGGFGHVSEKPGEAQMPSGVSPEHRESMRKSSEQPRLSHVLRHMPTAYHADPAEKIIGVRRNADRARLQQLIADFDPEERGEWAKAELTAQRCVDLLQGHHKQEVSLECIEDILLKLHTYLHTRHPAPEVITQTHLLNLTSLKQIDTIFGKELSNTVMDLQDAVVADLTNTLVSMGVREPIDGAWRQDSRRKIEKACTRLRGITAGGLLEVLGTSLVLANTVTLGLSLDVLPGWVGWDWISAGFAVAFLVELLVRIKLRGGFHAFYRRDGWRWHVFDTIIVLFAMLDLLTLIVGSAHVSSRTLMVARVARLPRLTRITRLARLSVFHELSYMLRGIEAGISTLLWSLVLLMMVCYIGGVLLTQTIGRDTVDEDFRPYAEKHFSTVPLSMFSLFRCFTGDCSVFDGRPMGYILLERYGPIVIPTYLVVIIGVTVGMFNVIVANFLQNAQRAAKFNDVEKRRMLRRERKMVNEKTAKLLRRVQEIYLGKPSQMRGRVSVADLKISREMFGEILRDPQVIGWLDDMGCDDDVRHRLFDKIDRDGNGELEAQEFVTGVVDFLRGRFDNMETLNSLMRSINMRLIHLEGALRWDSQANALGQRSGQHKPAVGQVKDAGQQAADELGCKSVSCVRV
mmetsp:Transcript_18848/g.54487  ORF Transcript_18848/g.54487 Transcript_18848/m.54487 type:complete len:677 (+) Transcript_18848:107-2137(+)